MAAAAVSAVGMVLACPDFDLWWLAFVMWVPWFWAIEGVTPRRALGYGLVTGTITVFWGFFWLSELLTKFAGFSLAAAMPVSLLFSLWHGLLWGLPAMMVVWLRRHSAAPVWVTAPFCWIVVEAFLPNIFPIYMSHAWCWQPLWIQTAELGGPTLVSGLMLAINAGAYTLLRRWWTDRVVDRPAAIVTLGLIVGLPVYGAIRIAQVEATMEAAPKLEFGVVQGNMSIRQMGDPNWKHWIFRQQQGKSAELQAQGADVILWGETAYPNSRIFKRDSTEEPPPGHPWRIHEGFDAPVIVGAVTRGRDLATTPYPYNSALLIDGDGRIQGRYDKVYRLIFGEYIPIVDPQWYLEKIPSASHLEKGEGPSVLELRGHRLGPLICYEDILPRFVRDTAALGIHAFVNLTNDAWFGKTAEPAQHLGLAVMRTVEHRKPLVRAVNTGISTYIDPTGRTHIKTRVTDPDIEGPQPAEGFVVSVPMMDPEARTPYTITGELFNVLSLFFVIGLRVRGGGAPGTGPRAAGAQDENGDAGKHATAVGRVGASVKASHADDRAGAAPP